MIKVVAINGSPRMEKGNTGMILTSFLNGMTGVEVDVFYTKRLKIKSCTGELHCWYRNPGKCHIQDDMQPLYTKLREADILVLATPVYIPLPGEMQDVINRLCPLIEPILESRQGRTRAKLHEKVKIRKIALVAVGGWWEKSNLNTVTNIVEDLAKVMNVEFAGAVLRPHAYQMKEAGKLTKRGEAVLKSVKQAGYELISKGRMSEETLEMACLPLISAEELLCKYNAAYEEVRIGTAGNEPA